MKTYQEMSLEERVEIQQRLDAVDSIRAIARTLGRAPSTISRERRRVTDAACPDYRAQVAQRQAKACRRKPRVRRKLADAALWEIVQDLLRARWSPQPIAGILSKAFPDEQALRVSHETIYNAIYLIPRGELRKDLVASLRHGHSTRKPRTRGTDRRGQIPDMQSIHVRPPEVEDRLIPGHWGG